MVEGVEAGSEGSGDNAQVEMVIFVGCSGTGCQVVGWRAPMEAKKSFAHFIISCSGFLYNIPDEVDSGVNTTQELTLPLIVIRLMGSEEARGSPMVLRLECAAESPGGLFKTDCWAPCPEFLIQQV